MACLMNYTIQCTDVVSGKIGCFLFDIPHYQRTGKFKAISPVFPDLYEFFQWDNANGERRKGQYIDRE
ncbi:MAG: hypothetical protein ACK52V_06500 [Betaproteobacteria bacterium]